jgi:hypothetical protein
MKGQSVVVLESRPARNEDFINKKDLIHFSAIFTRGIFHDTSS